MAKEGESREQDGKRGRPDEKPEHRVVSLSAQTVFKVFFSKSSGIPPSLRYGATLAALRTRRSSKSEGGFRRQPENSAARACIDHKSLDISTQLL
jgi:hypothetical protein